jgi:threonine/homoserine/homoserine lactone efflux protein
MPHPVGTVHLQPEAPSTASVFRAGFLVALLNPKTALFFAAFLPQFIDPAAGSPMMQSVALGGAFVVVAAGTDAVYVLIAARLAPRPDGGGRRSDPAAPADDAATHLRRRFDSLGRSGRYLTSASFIGLGIWTALAGQRAAK